MLEMQRLETYEATDTAIASRDDDLHRRAQTSVFRTYLIYVISAVVPLGTWFYVQDTPITATVGIVCFLYLLAMSLLARSYGRNITRTLEADAAEKNSESRFRDFAELGADVFWEVDTEMRYTHIFGRYEEMMGKSRIDLVGENRLEMLDPSDAESYQEHLDIIKNQLRFDNYEVSCTKPDGAVVVLSSSGKPIFDEQENFTGYRGVARNITQAHHLSQTLKYQSTHDMLTDLTNRRELERRVKRALDQTFRADEGHVLCFMDLDQFKVVNDTCGHTAGDELLRQLSMLLKQYVRSRDTLARLGGDEFCLLLEHCSLEQATRVVDNVREAISEFRFEWEGRTFHVGVSVGIIPITSVSGNLEQIMSGADSACYAAKEAGRNRIHVYREDDVTLAKRNGEMQWVSRITQALGEDQFVLFGQPISKIDPIAKARDSVQLLVWQPGDEPLPQPPASDSHLEVLVRMLDDDGATIPPGAFLPAAERYNLSSKIDKWVVQATFDWLICDPDRLDKVSCCSINLSGNSLGEDNFVDFVVGELERTEIPAHKICFEITETAAITRLGSATRLISKLKELGCRFALDDFGSGLSSFGYLKNLPVDFLKIDGQFIRDIVTDPIDFSMVKSINEIGQIMGKQTIAEFVENDEILERLRELGVDYAQGYGVGKPQPIDELLN